MSFFHKDLFILFRLLSFSRVFNMAGLYAGYLVSKITRKPHIWAEPFAISIEPNSSCNLTCIECATGNKSIKRIGGKIEFDDFKNIIDQVYKKTFYLNLFLQGEPFLHPELTELAAYAKQKKMFVTISTNGHFFTAEMCEKIIASGGQKIIVSMDGVTQETYEKYRTGGNLNQVMSGTRMLSETKKKHLTIFPLIYIQMLVNSYNENEIYEMKKLCRNIGADKLELKSMQLFNHFDFLPIKDKHKRYFINSEGKIVSLNKLRNTCFRLWSTAVITWNGDLTPCCYDKNAEHKIGNIKNTSLRKLWRSNEFNLFRQNILKSRKSIEICRNCNE